MALAWTAAAFLTIGVGSSLAGERDTDYKHLEERRAGHADLRHDDLE
jgi:hypothetical protein